MSEQGLDKLMLVAVVCIAAGIAYRIVRWFWEGTPGPDPWGKEVEAEMEAPEAHCLCSRCLEPLADHQEFCQHCGLPVGTYTNVSPYLYIFSLGDVLRTGTSGNFLARPMSVVGFILLSLAEYLIFAPIYWFFLFRNLRHRHADHHAASPPLT